MENNLLGESINKKFEECFSIIQELKDLHAGGGDSSNNMNGGVNNWFLKMDLDKYVNKRVKIDLTNSFYYEGVVLSVDSDSLTLKDRYGHFITLSIKSILFVREIK